MVLIHTVWTVVLNPIKDEGKRFEPWRVNGQHG
jgi:hypothetical protein